jgi:5-methyltetrahydropteroyltriglutamate--homocysteine methyltransferase
MSANANARPKTRIQRAANGPPFRADHVGSLLRPASLKAARADWRAGRLSAAELKAVEDREILRVVRRQEEIGLKAVTDGEFRRAWWHLDFLAGFDGAELYELEQGFQFEGVQTRAEGVRVVDRLGFSGHPMLEHFAFLKANARQTAKMAIPSPSAMYGRFGRRAISADAYPWIGGLFEDLGHVYAQAVAALAAAGCRYLQFDEVFLALICDPKQRAALAARGDDPGALPAAYAAVINAAAAAAPEGMTLTVHLCRGNFRSTFIGAGGYEPIADLLFNGVDVDGYFMEYDTDRAGDFEPLRLLPKGKRAVLGLVTSKFGQLESKDALKRRIDEAARYVDLDQLCLSPQCGFASTEEGNVLAEEEQWAKLAMIIGVATEVWGGV